MYIDVTCHSRQNKSLVLMEAPIDGSVVGEDPSMAAAESGGSSDGVEDSPPEAAENGSSSGAKEGESHLLAALSEPELDLLISLRELAVMRAKTAGHADLRSLFDLRTLRALGVVLLEDLKGRLKENSVNPNGLDRLALLSGPDGDFTDSASDPEVAGPNKDQSSQSTSNSINKKRVHMQDGCHDEEVAENHKKRKTGEKM